MKKRTCPHIETIVSLNEKKYTYIYLTNKEALAVYYTEIKHDVHLRARRKCRKHEPQASVFHISRMFSNVQSVSSHCNKELRLLHLLYDIEVK